ncbi:MAG: BTAD domain-containing putative transcriptional regulator [Acidimicrobiia bacterium]
MEFRILGPTEVVDHGEPVPLPAGRARSLLGLLALKADEVVSTDQLIDALWGETPPSTVNTALQGLVSQLRRRLEPHRARGEPPSILLTRPPGYLLAVNPDRIDADQFRHLVADAAESPPEEAARLLRIALALWRGPALADFRYEPFAQTEIAELEELRQTALEKRVEADLALGRHRDVIGELERLVVEHPLRESSHGLLMLAMYRSGRQAEALQVYADLRRTLVDELGLDPSPSLHELEVSILRQDPSLELGPRQPSEPSAAGGHWITEERRTVTVLFVEVSVSADGNEPTDSEISRRLLERFFPRAIAVVTGHGGSVERVVGDALVGTFGVPLGREDDALRALRAAIDLRHLVAAFDKEQAHTGRFRLIARAGIDTGEVVVGATAGVLAGSPVRGATQLHHRAGEGEILVGKGTRLLIGNAVLFEPLEIDTDDGPHQAVWRVLDLLPGVPAHPLKIEAPMVGRERELGELVAAFGKVVREGLPYRLTTLGEPGIGKSRLALELAAVSGSEAWALTGHCPSYGEGITFWPLREIVLAAAGRIGTGSLQTLLRGVEDALPIAKEVLSAIGSGESIPSHGAIFPMARRFFEALASDRPVVLILEDLHWAQPTFLDLVDYITKNAHSPLFILCLARPEFCEEHPDWVKGVRAGSLMLGPLGPAESRTLAANRLTGRLVPTEVVMRVLDVAQGNPLFVEQLLAAIGEEGDFSTPATVQALLAARIDRLGPAERDLIRFASVLGHRFPIAALISLLPEPARPHALRHLRTLVGKDLMIRSGDSLPSNELGFRHVLIQEAAYRSMTKRTRSELHERAAEWLEAEAGDSNEFDETIGYHLEHAFDYLRELGDLDARGRELAVRAGEKLAEAGIRAFDRFDAAAAESLLSRAKRLLPVGHEAGWELGYRLAEAHETMGRHGDADEVLSDLLKRTPYDADTRQRLQLEQVRVRLATGPDPMTLVEIRDQAVSAHAHYKAAGEEAGLGQALFVLAEIHLRAGRMEELEAAARRGLTHADRSDNARAQLGARRMMATALEVGPRPVSESIRECDRLAIWRGRENAAVLPILARLLAMVGEFDRARDLIARAEVILMERARARRPLVLVRKRHAEVETQAGDLGAAEHQLRQALQLGLSMDLREEASEVAALLSRVLSQREAFNEAAEMADLSRSQAPSESVTSQALWRSTRALGLAARGHAKEAIPLAQAAAALVPHTMLNLRADMFLDLGQAFMALGYREEARDAIDTAISSYERKENRVSASQARLLVPVGK